MTSVKEPEALVRELSEERVPPEDPSVLAARRERMIAGIGRTIREAAVDRERSARRRKVFAVGLSLAAAAALVVGVSVRALHTTKVAPVAAPVAQPVRVAEVQSLTGTLVVTHAGRARVVDRNELPTLVGGDELETAADGEATLQTERSRIQVQPATQVSVLSPSVVEERIRLALGRLDLKVSKQPHSPRSVVVETPDAEVVVRGTEFTVAVGSENDVTLTRVRVTEGAVWVLHQGERELLSVGEEWASNGERKGKVGVDQDAAPAPVPTAVESAPLAPRSSRKAALNAAASRAQAVAASSLREQNRMYQVALDARNRGDDRKALELFAALIATYPDGHYAELAQVERMRALKRLGDRVSAAAEARRYLSDHGHEFARDEARGIVLGDK
jgi:hypothetical protein